MFPKYFSDVGEDCHVDDDCLFDNSKCDNAKCSCQEGYFASEGLCIQGIDSHCTDDAQCSHVGNSTCDTTTGACVCLDGFVSSENEEFCLPGKNCKRFDQSVNLNSNRHVVVENFPPKKVGRYEGGKGSKILIANDAKTILAYEDPKN